MGGLRGKASSQTQFRGRVGPAFWRRDTGSLGAFFLKLKQGYAKSVGKRLQEGCCGKEWERGGGCLSQAALPHRTPASSERSVWEGQRVVPGPPNLQPRARRRAGWCPVYPLGPVVDSRCHASLPLNHCVCPAGTLPLK